MSGSRRLAILSALALAGCVSSGDEPFPLDDGEAVSLAADGYVCDTFDAKGKTAAAAQQGRLILLRRNKKSQYAFIGDKTSGAEPFTLHNAGGNLYIVAVAHSEAAGEDLYVAQFADAGKEFQFYTEGDGFDVRAKTVARERGVTLAHNQFSSDLSGPIDAQKAFMIDLASDLKGWRLSADCWAKP